MRHDAHEVTACCWAAMASLGLYAEVASRWCAVNTWAAEHDRAQTECVRRKLVGTVSRLEDRECSEFCGQLLSSQEQLVPWHQAGF